MLTVHDVQALSDSRLRVAFSNQKSAEVDIADYLDAPGYESLRAPAVFSQVRPEEWGNGVEWPGDIEIPVSALYRMAREQAGKAWPVEKFNAWMQRHQLSAAGAAAALGVARRTILHYHTGSKPIPLMVGLACEGYEARLARVNGSHSRDDAGLYGARA